jgi:hypothetical protein
MSFLLQNVVRSTKLNLALKLAEHEANIFNSRRRNMTSFELQYKIEPVKDLYTQEVVNG